MSIRSKLTVMFLAIGLVPVLILSTITFTHYINSIESNRLRELQHITTFMAEKIETYFTTLKSTIEVAQTFYNIKKNLPVLTQFISQPDTPEFIAAQKMLDGQLQPMQQVLRLSNIILVNTLGKIVYVSEPIPSLRNSTAALIDSHPEVLSEGKNKVFFSDLLFQQGDVRKPIIILSAPSYGFNHIFSGVIVFIVDIAPFYQLLQEYTGLGKTGETLIGKKIGNEILFLSPLRHEPGAALKKRINIGERIGIPIQKAVLGNIGKGKFIDYRGKKVIAAWRYIKSLGWGIVSKIDTEEAFADAVSLGTITIIIFTFILVIGSIISFFITRSISEPIKNLIKGAEIIGSGNLDFQVATNLKDEIGQLSRSFDKMTRDLKGITASRDELNREINERKRAEDLSRENYQRMNRSQEIAHLGSWELDLINNKLSWSDEVYRIFGLQPQEFGATYEAFLEAVHPEDREAVNNAYTDSMVKGTDTYEIEHRVIRKSNSEVRIVHEKCDHFRDETGRIIKSVGMVHDITERKKVEDELKRSNENLEQFAYVASHDLQEPLRIMASYSQLLERRYKPKLEQDAIEFIGYIVAAAGRMQDLINDLLTYSRIGFKDGFVNDVDCNEILHRVINSMSVIIESTNGKVTFDLLPVIKGYASSFEQLFQNLVGNALKFHGCDAPIVHLSVTKNEFEWIFSVKDNGIGIEPQYREKIFLIFQRLHSRKEYPGTGIGLSICKKIVENYGGRIWVESTPGKGSIFYFTIPLKGG